MSIHFPPEFKKYLSMPNIKGAFVSKIEGRHPRDCKNCGGVGTIVLFCAFNGPFRDVPSGIAHFTDGHWWAGKNFEEMCPDCKGNGIDPNYIEQPTRQRELDISTVVKHVEKREYSDV
jgi:hypothetical protein